MIPQVSARIIESKLTDMAVAICEVKADWQDIATQPAWKEYIKTLNEIYALLKPPHTSID